MMTYTQSLIHTLRRQTSTAEATEPLVDIRTFVLGDRYLGLSGFWPAALQTLEALRRPGCMGGVIEQGIGGGKSYTVSVLPLYDIYTLAYEEFVLGKDPRRRFGLADEMVIYAGIFTITATLAYEIFRMVQTFALQCAWFRAHMDIDEGRSRELHFRDRQGRVRYIVYPGHSGVSSSVGRSLYSFILDEANFFDVAESAGSSGRDYAEDLYEQLDDRRRSRFGEHGSSLIISSRRTINDFSTRLRLRLHQSSDRDRYYLPEPRTTWDLWPETRKRSSKWKMFDSKRLLWISSPMEYGQTMQRVGLWVPKDYWASFEINPEAALRNLASIPGEALEPFVRLRDRIKPSYDMTSPLLPGVQPADWMTCAAFDDLVRDDWYGDPDDRYHFHIDLAARWDACGLVLARCSGVDEVALQTGETKPERTALVDVEAIFCVRSPHGSEVSFERVREIIYWLRNDRGFRLGASSYDGWQSKDSIQILQRKGIVVDVESMDGTGGFGNYQTLKDTLYEGRLFFYPAHGQTPRTTTEQLALLAQQGDPSAIMQIELMRLESINGKKVDHPKGGSKDLADALCGAVVQTTRYMRSGREY